MMTSAQALHGSSSDLPHPLVDRFGGHVAVFGRRLDCKVCRSSVIAVLGSDEVSCSTSCARECARLVAKLCSSSARGLVEVFIVRD